MDRGADFYAQKARLILENLPKGPTGRVRRGIHKEISEASGGLVDRNYLHLLAGGKITSPALEKLEALALVLGFPIEWWSLPLEAGPPPMGKNGKNILAVLARLVALSPDQQKLALRRFAEVLEELERSR